MARDSRGRFVSANAAAEDMRTRFAQPEGA